MSSFGQMVGNTKHWIGLSMVLRPRRHSIGYMGDGLYRSKDIDVSDFCAEAVAMSLA